MGSLTNPIRQLLVTRQHAHEPSALRLTSGEYAVRVDTVLRLDVVEYISGEAKIVRLYSWNTLPRFLLKVSTRTELVGSWEHDLYLGTRTHKFPLTLIPLGYTTI